MTSGMFKNVPTELLDEISSWLLSLNDRRHLSEVDTRLRQILAPRLYSTIRFSNRSWEQDIIKQVIAKYGHYARGLYLTLDLSTSMEGFISRHEKKFMTESDFEDDHGAKDVHPPYADWACLGLPNPTRNLLTGQTLPNVSSITVEFRFWPDDHFVMAEWGGSDMETLGIGYFRGEAEVNFEEYVEWRACLAAIWQALTENSRIRRLVIEDLLPVWTTTYSRPSWAAFLGNLETLELGLGYNWEEMMNDGGYREFIEDLEVFFYRHATNLRRFALVAHPNIPLGSGRTLDMPPLWASGPTDDIMPRLREARFENVTVCPDLAEFIACRSGEAGTLVRVELVNCAAAVEKDVDNQAERVEDLDFYDDEVTWGDFFDCIQEKIADRDIDDSYDDSDEDEIDMDNRLPIRSSLEEFILVQSEPVPLTDEYRWGGISSRRLEVRQQRAQQLRDRVRELYQKSQQPQGRLGGHDGSCTTFPFNEAEWIFPYMSITSGELRPCGHLNLLMGERGYDAIFYREIRHMMRESTEARQMEEDSKRCADG